MPRVRHVDIIVELVDLCQERMDEVRQQMAYFRASVYKAEMAAQIKDRVESLRLIASLLADDGLSEAFRDYDAMKAAGAMAVVPGECSFSKRMMTLLGALDTPLFALGKKLAAKTVAPESELAFEETVRQHRLKLLELCRHGSRQWTFFQAL